METWFSGQRQASSSTSTNTRIVSHVSTLPRSLVSTQESSNIVPSNRIGGLQGLPFCVAGIGDLLALFRCISCRYCFGTDATKPDLLGAPGRVFTTQEVWPPSVPWVPCCARACLLPPPLSWLSGAVLRKPSLLCALRAKHAGAPARSSCELQLRSTARFSCADATSARTRFLDAVRDLMKYPEVLIECLFPVNSLS